MPLKSIHFNGNRFSKIGRRHPDPDTEQEAQEIRSALTGVKLILSVDRLDYTKGILNRLEGYELFLETNPEYHGKVALLMVVVPSRIGVVQYELMKRQIEDRRQINGRLEGSVGRRWSISIATCRRRRWRRSIRSATSAWSRLCGTA
jgi:trehalose-6-phosphate synthase